MQVRKADSGVGKVFHESSICARNLRTTTRRAGSAALHLTQALDLPRINHAEMLSQPGFQPVRPRCTHADQWPNTLISSFPKDSISYVAACGVPKIIAGKV